MLREKVAKLTKLLFAGATMALCVAAVIVLKNQVGEKI